MENTKDLFECPKIASYSLVTCVSRWYRSKKIRHNVLQLRSLSTLRRDSGILCLIYKRLHLGVLSLQFVQIVLRFSLHRCEDLQLSIWSVRLQIARSPREENNLLQCVHPM